MYVKRMLFLFFILLSFFSCHNFIIKTNEDSLSDSGLSYTDSDSGLIWQTDIVSKRPWSEAVSYCNDLNYDGKDDWRLPTISELRTLIKGCAGTMPGGVCEVSSDSPVCLESSCYNESNCSCDWIEGPGNEGHYLDSNIFDWDQGANLWSSSEVTDNSSDAWWFYCGSGKLSTMGKTGNRQLICVR